MTRGPEIWFEITKVRHTKGSLYRETYNLPARIQGTGGPSVRNSGKARYKGRGS